ncbi:MAG: universal stress protein [Pseudomonadota bacterium]
MKPRQQILAATDLSAPARHAVARAYGIAAETGAALDVVHVLSENALDGLRRMLGVRDSPAAQYLLDEAREALAQLGAELGQTHRVSAGSRVVEGHALRAILEQADALDADLLVLGARGENYLRHLLLGATAERLLRRSLRPMLVVKQTPRTPYRRVLVPVDFSPWSAPSLRLARAWAPGAELVLLHAFEAPFESRLRYAGVEEDTIEHYRVAARQDALVRLDALVAAAGLRPEEVRYGVHHGDASRVILTQEQERDCDLIVLGKHGQGVLEELLLGSVTKHVLAESAGDVLVASHPEPGA